MNFPYLNPFNLHRYLTDKYLRYLCIAKGKTKV